MMKTIKGFGKGWEAPAGRPIKDPAVHQQAADDDAMTRQKLRRRMHDQVCAEFNRTTQIGRREGGINHYRNAGSMGNFRNCGDVQDFHARITHNLTKYKLGIVLNGGCKSRRVSWINKGGGNAESWQGVAEQIVRAAIQTPGCDNVIPSAHQRCHRKMHRGLTTGNRNRAHTLVEHGDALLQHGIGRV